MKNTILYILLILAFFGLTYFLNKDRKPDFKWEPTYSQHDKQPFGAYVFDEVLKESLKYTYTHSYKSIYQLLNEDRISNQNLMILTNYFGLSEGDQQDLFQYVKDGNKVMIAASDFSYDFLDSLHLSVSSSGFSTYVSNKLNIREHLKTVSFYEIEGKKARYRFPTVMFEGYFKPYGESKVEPAEDDSVMIDVLPAIDFSCLEPVTVLAEDEDSNPVLLKYPLGKGYLILSTTPKMFTNYGVLDPINGGFVWRTLGYLQDRPLLRTESYEAGTDQSTSPLRYVLSNRALRWGFYISLITVFLFMIFTAKRKQRVIPVIKPPENKMLSFVRSIAALYLRKNDNADIVRKKYVYWSDRMKQQYGIDVINSKHDREFCLVFASKTGQLPDAILDLFRQLDAIRPENVISNEEMKMLVEKMNSIK